MLLLAIFAHDTDKGNVIPGLALAATGGLINVVLWKKYEKLGSIESSSIFTTQSRLYKIKSLIDIFISLTLFLVVLFPTSIISHYFDLCGSVILAIYLIWCGSELLGN